MHPLVPFALPLFRSRYRKHSCSYCCLTFALPSKLDKYRVLYLASSHRVALRRRGRAATHTHHPRAIRCSNGTIFLAEHACVFVESVPWSGKPCRTVPAFAVAVAPLGTPPTLLMIDLLGLFPNAET
jgi:hypothetical protein